MPEFRGTRPLPVLLLPLPGPQAVGGVGQDGLEHGQHRVGGEAGQQVVGRVGEEVGQAVGAGQGQAAEGDWY